MKAWKIAVADRSAVLTHEATARDTVWRAVEAGHVVSCEAVDVRTDKPIPASTPESPLVHYLLDTPEPLDPNAHCDLCGYPYHSKTVADAICPACLDDMRGARDAVRPQPRS